MIPPFPRLRGGKPQHEQTFRFAWSGPAIDGSNAWDSPLLDGNPARAWNPSSRSSLLESPGPSPGEDVMARQIEDLLLLTCLGGFVAGITYAVTLLH
jgi:hypothetical protein